MALIVPVFGDYWAATEFTLFLFIVYSMIPKDFTLIFTYYPDKSPLREVLPFKTRLQCETFDETKP